MAGGFHEGELAVQQRAGVRADAARLSGMLAPADLGGGASRFLAERTFAALTARDHDGRLWISPLIGPGGFLAGTDTTLRIHAVPGPGDPLRQPRPGQPVGVLAIEFATRRRLRVNGVLTVADADELRVEVQQAYGNCPQYIQQRRLEPVAVSDADPSAVQRTSTLDPRHIAVIRRADTFLLGTTHPDRGNDASHRGGTPGFVRVDEDTSTLWWPDYPGNNMFNSLGNLAVDDSAALLFIDYPQATVLQLSGTAAVEWVNPGSDGDDGGTGRRVRFTPHDIIDGRVLPVRVTDGAPSPYNWPLS